MCYNQAQDLGNSYVMRCEILIIFIVSFPTHGDLHSPIGGFAREMGPTGVSL